VIRLEALTKYYGEIRAVHNLSFSVEKGEVFALLGPNGAGKTTTIRMLTTLTKPSSGRARVAGYDVLEEPLAVKRRIGIAPQHLNLDGELTARENLEFHGRLYHMPRRERRRRIAELLAFVELEERADDLVENFSGGMKRRLLIARALMHSPEVLFLDEPTVGLDAATRRKIWDLIRSLRSEGVTVLMTTHYIEEAEQLCDRVGIIDRGELIALDSPSRLKRRLGSFAVEVYHSGRAERRFFPTREEALEYGAEHARCLDCDFSVRETNLEDVFIELTGRRIE
jgi:ABC-2 type transport system ATP-binding protein